MINGVTAKIQIDRLLLQALQEDITAEDVTTNAIVKGNPKGQAQLICKEGGILAGITVFQRVFELLDEDAVVETVYQDGDVIEKGSVIATVTGNVKAILSGERVALNYLQRMCGIATLTRDMAEQLKNTKTKLLDTRKTTPNMRIFEKYAVTVGGGCNHRYNLSDGVLIKDNHICAAGGVKEAIMMAKKYAPFVRKIEVEAETLEMVEEAVAAGADIIMLDNMDDDTMAQAIKMIGGRAQTECSGNVSKERLKSIGALGVDFVSCGALTHSAPVLDLSLKNLKVL
ncbi:MAG: carboxylating nicotinate-nucleotide diphosphorylase [Epulopiscium sp.]|jgi:nicotinate-nucleotide pyrophosphorylase (carboxylating)|nr:carboxylating nicotinate-nucleotide diphosphorylase [Candidatus Epulonipiscium sp.]